MMKLNSAATITEEFAERIKSENRSAKMMKLAPLIVLACLVVVFLIVCGASFLSPKNIMNILNQMALPLVVALGLTFVIMLGSIDLSIDGSVGMAGSLFACFVLNSEFAYDLGFLSVVIAVGVSMLCGLLIGLCHVYLKIPSFMASFAFMYICKGIGMVSYQGHPPTIKDPVITALPTTTFLGIPFITWVAIVMFLLCFFIQEYTAFGRHIYAVGTNENIPRSVGVSVEKVKIGVFTLAGFLFGVAGVMGLLVGGLSSGFVLAVFMANAGGAWDNAKKMVEEGHFGGKGSDCHKATVVGDTLGDPFKDTSGPSLNILIKLMSMVSIVMAGLTVAFHLF